MIGADPAKLNERLMAPCGINCALCSAFLREKNRCPGCRSGSGETRSHFDRCVILNCEFHRNNSESFCINCEKFPCKRMKDLDRRYSKNHGVHIKLNMERIREIGLSAFFAEDLERNKCPECGGVLCMHNDLCYICEAEKKKKLKTLNKKLK